MNDHLGHSNTSVRGRMYSRNPLLNVLHIKSDRWLCVNEARKCFTFHADSEGLNFKSSTEVPFHKIQNVDAKISTRNMMSDAYYITVTTDEGTLDFKLKNNKDFLKLMESLKHAVKESQDPFFKPQPVVLQMLDNYSNKDVNDLKHVRWINKE